MTNIRIAALSMERIDTHGHWTTTPDNLRDMANGSKPVNSLDMMRLRMCAESARLMYGVDSGAFFRPEEGEEVFQKAAALRAGGWIQAYAQAMNQARIRTQFIFDGPLPFNEDWGSLALRLRYLAFIDPVIIGDWQSFSPDYEQAHPDFNFYRGLCGQLQQEPASLDQYLEALDRIMEGWIVRGVVGMKVGFAYTIGLAFGNPSLDEARAAFHRKEAMTPADCKIVQDYAFRHSLHNCKRHGLPVLIHTGFQIWGHASLWQSNPMHLHNLIVDPSFRDLTFVLLHGGNPYTAETAYLAGMFPNVVIDFTWIAWMSRARFRLALTDWLECVPFGRFVWGSDSGSPEGVVAVDAVVRREIAGVLESMTREGLMDERASLEFLEQCYLGNPKRIFNV